MELWYTQPAADWNAALPAGNGRLGCMQFGGVARERFQLNEDSLWSGGPMHRLNPDASATLPKVQELLRQGRLPDAERLALDGLASTPCGMRAYQPLGDLTLDFDGLPAEADDYCRGLDLDAGTLYVRFTVGGAHYAREAFASYPDGVFVLRLATDAPQGLSLRCRLDRKRREETGHLDDATIYFTGDSDGIGFAAAVRLAEHDGGTVRAVGDTLLLRGAKSATFLLAAATTYREAEPLQAVTACLVAAAKRGYMVLKERYTEDICKNFHGVAALKHISFKAYSGQVLSLVGENGAGKSTLLKILGGDYQPSSGTYRINGEEKHFASPYEAIRAGVGLIYQERQMAPELTVAENIFMGALPKKGPFVDFKTLYARAKALLEEFGLDIAPTEKLKNLSAAMQQMVEIIKVYSRRPKLIAFDEPTTALTEAEAEKLFYIIEEKLKKQDIIILYVSHRMNEVFRLSDRIVVFKDGELVHTAVTAETDEEAIVQRMVGRPLEKVFGELKRNAPAEDCILRVTGYSGRGFQDASFTLRRGEVIGFYGLVGAGRTELMRGIFGADEISGGQLELNGECLRFTSPGQAVKKGVAFLTEDRKDQGIFSQQGVRENISVVSLKKLKNLWFLSSRKENQFAREQCEKLTVKTSSIHKKIAELSGGNQQKALLARWLAMDPEILILDEPTKGIDVGAKAEIYRIIRDIAAQGISVIVVSSELPEIIGLSDRIYVMKSGRIVKELPAAEATEETVIAWAMMTNNAGGTQQ